ncbi:MAG: undecaprenyl-diphosphatase [Rhodospirillales bacterium]|nr:undecaprenyl-diphosphatase [Rhodospirillales bacterium]
MLIALNRRMFLALNASAHPYAALVLLAKFAAVWAVYVAMTLVAGLWIWGRPHLRGRLLATVGGVSLALGINQILGMLWYEKRPFAIGLGHVLIPHAADNSFPSDHATFIWSLGFSLILAVAADGWGVVVLLTGLLVAWARIYLGVHYPIDMATSLLVSVVGGALSVALVPVAERFVLPPVEALYLRMLTLFHLPTRLFPRASDARDTLPFWHA